MHLKKKKERNLNFSIILKKSFVFVGVHVSGIFFSFVNFALNVQIKFNLNSVGLFIICYEAENNVNKLYFFMFRDSKQIFIATETESLEKKTDFRVTREKRLIFLKQFISNRVLSL